MNKNRLEFLLYQAITLLYNQGMTDVEVLKELGMTQEEYTLVVLYDRGNAYD